MEQLDELFGVDTKKKEKSELLNKLKKFKGSVEKKDEVFKMAFDKYAKGQSHILNYSEFKSFNKAEAEVIKIIHQYMKLADSFFGYEDLNKISQEVGKYI
jgi:hypothetical protein